MELGTDYQQLLTSLRERRPDIMYFLTKGYATTCEAVLQKTFEPESIKPLEWTANLQEIQRTEDHAKLYYGDISGKNQTMRNFTG